MALMSISQTFPSTHSDQLHRAITGLVLDVFQLNGDLLATGDAMVQDLGLTSARWQVLGAVARSPVALPVAHVARNIGLARQSVQRVVDDMQTDGLVRLDPNPHHRRAMLINMTEQGQAAYLQASARQKRWAIILSADLPTEEIEAASGLLRTLRQRLAEPSSSNPDSAAAATAE
jgi:DNA-binding MarR family transcriptional regulator